METKQPKSFTKITKVSLVIYCSILAAGLIAVLIPSIVLNKLDILWGYLLCLGPNLAFVLVSTLFPVSKMFAKEANKGLIAVCVIIYVLKYALVIGIPFIGIYNPSTFNRWSMLGLTLAGPLFVILSKAIIANIVSKNSKTDEKNTQNTIKF